ncbi:MAG TPA: hypothetical protein PLD20_07310 [Blastocatellia bacterium]|nr:hypothetical protein [Blastocatellia bacterium]HMV85938.1 hypothetical protein [Blastocatellia bacterium]HMX29555.1 hypothetical protein [Blastocatellia bacterium]HMY74299.1 hypothetical protein [Blastocatellia bacterium]HMZ17719.1 hypothetical protein [Blastocatellia bacterium]
MRSNLDPARQEFAASSLTAQDLLAGSSVVHEVSIPEAILRPQLTAAPSRIAAGAVRLRPLSVGGLTLISRAAREDAGLVPLLMIKESLVEPALSLDQIRQMHIGLVQFLVSRINLISGLGADGESYEDVLQSGIGQTHLLLAKHFGWTPEQVAQLTPAQVMVYLTGIERLLAFDEERTHSHE